MACQYWYDGQWRSEKEFKTILDNGLLDSLLKDNKIAIEGLEVDEIRLKEFKKLQVKKKPITLRILHKSQTRINNERTPEGDFKNNNPVKVLEKAFEENGKKVPFKIVIKIQGELKVGKGKNNEKLLTELKQSDVYAVMVNNLKEGVPYMLVPSAYGLYPVQIKSHKLKDTSLFNVFKTALSELANAKNEKDAFEARKKIEKMLYRTTIDRVGGKIKVTVYNSKTNTTTLKEFDNQEDVINYLQDKLVRVDYDSINQGTYNETLANAGAISTDLFSEDGNFFNSSSFVLEAYQLSENDKDVFNGIFETKIPKDSSFTATFSTQDTPAVEPVISNATMSDINAASHKVTGSGIKNIFVGNSNFPWAKVTFDIVDNKPVVRDIIFFQKTKRQNANDLITFAPTKPSSSELQDVTKRFFALPDIQKLTPKVVAKEETPTPTAPKSVIKSALSNIIDSTVQEAPPVEEQGSLENLLVQAENTETVSEDLSEPTDLGFDIDLDGDVLNSPSDTKLRHTAKTDGTKWDKKQEIKWLQDKLGTKTMQRGKNGTLRVFSSIEAIKEYLPDEVYEMLIESRKQGKELHGVFTKAAVLLSSNAASGTTYHEAFHVVFNLALPLNRRIEILNEAMEMYADELSENPTFLEVEELLADKFMEYTEAREKVDVTLPMNIKRFFKGLYRTLRYFFRPGAKINIADLFEDVNLGVYKNRIKFEKKSRKTLSKNSVKLRESNPHLKYDNPEEEREAFTYMSNVIDRIITQYKNFNNEPLLTDKEVIE